ncbi:hypothetical protein AMTR_s00033p00099570, partial [Amborella trichopoda]
VRDFIDSKSPDSETASIIGEGFPVVESTTKVGGEVGEELVEEEGGQTILRPFLRGGGHGGFGGGHGGGPGKRDGAIIFFRIKIGVFYLDMVFFGVICWI